MILDRIKGSSDDFEYTEEHILFLMGKYRSFFLKQQYKAGIELINQSNYQTICLDLEKNNKGICEDIELISTKEIPSILSITSPIIYPSYDNINIVYVNKDRYRFVGHNKYMTNIIYACKGFDNKLHIKSNNPQFLYLTSVKMYGLFDDFEKAFEMSCDENKQCDIMDSEFPFENDLVPQMCDTIYNTLTNSVYKPSDTINDGSDSLATLANFLRNNMKSDLQKAIDG